MTYKEISKTSAVKYDQLHDALPDWAAGQFRHELSISDDPLWFRYCHAEDKDESIYAEMLSALEAWIEENLSEKLIAECKGRAGDFALHIEVLNHFEQDEHESVLWQEFEDQIERDARAERDNPRNHPMYQY